MKGTLQVRGKRCMESKGLGERGGFYGQNFDRRKMRGLPEGVCQRVPCQQEGHSGCTWFGAGG